MPLQLIQVFLSRDFAIECAELGPFAQLVFESVDLFLVEEVLFSRPVQRLLNRESFLFFIQKLALHVIVHRRTFATIPTVASISTSVAPATVIRHVHCRVMTKVTRVFHVVSESGSATMVGNSRDAALL